MPNYAGNQMQITCKGTYALSRVANLLYNDEGKLDFNVLLPQPSNEPDFDWYNWRIDNWGCKWNADNYHENVETIMTDTHKLTLGFFTPWGPPEGWFVKLVEEISKVDGVICAELEFEEMGNELAGKFVWNQGESLAYHEGTMVWVDADDHTQVLEYDDDKQCFIYVSTREECGNEDFIVVYDNFETID